MRLWTLIAGLLLALLPATANAAWWQNDWPYRKAITIDTTGTGVNVTGQLGRTVVLVRLHSGNFGFTDSLDNGADLRFVATDDKTPLPYHIESWDAQTQVATVWVSIPAVNGGEKQQIWMYYGNKTAPAGQDVAGTFDPDYLAVYHFGDKPGVASSDATANKNGAQTAPPGIDPGSVIAQGARFPGTGAITIAETPSLAMPAGAPFTFSAWVKPDQLTGEAALFARGPLIIGLANGVPFVTAGGGQLKGQQPLKQGDWSHLAVTADGKTIHIYVNGIEAGAGSAAFPAIAGPISLGGAAGRPFTGELDEVRLSKVARPAPLILAEAVNEGPGDKLLVFGNDEKQGGGTGALGTIVKNTPVDAWVVIVLLAFMLALAIWVMWTKSQQFGRAAKANAAFMRHFRRMDDLVPFEQVDDVAPPERMLIEQAPLKHLYDIGMEELAHRHRLRGSAKPLSAETIEAMRASVDAQMVEENERLDKWMVLLTIAISGGPFIGLLGTVLGVMLVFGAVAAAGDVNINAIAPGIASALLATVAGLAVAIPSLFGYNYLNSKVVSISNEMRVFVDRLITRLAETAHHKAPPPMAIAAE